MAVRLTLQAIVIGKEQFAAVEGSLKKLDAARKHRATQNVTMADFAKKEAGLTKNNLTEELALKQSRLELGRKGISDGRTVIAQNVQLREKIVQVDEAQSKFNKESKKAWRIQRTAGDQSVGLREKNLNLARDQIRAEDITNKRVQRRINRGKQLNALGRQRGDNAAFFMQMDQQSAKQSEANDNAKIQRQKVINMGARQFRMELMQASIGMFVLGITAGQTLATMQGMTEEGTLLHTILGELNTAFKFILGPVQVFTAAMQFATMASRELLIATMRTMGVFFLFYAIIRLIQKGLGALAVVIAGLAGAYTILTARKVAHIAVTKIENAETKAGIMLKVLNWIATAGPASPVVLAIIGATIGAALVGVGALLAQAQTVPGGMREIRETGPIFAHRGERIGRIGSMQPMGGGGINITINVESGAIVDEPLISKLGKEIKMNIASGSGA